ncbi:MAG: exonuclease SbcCD subunit D [Clostridiales bacterium]|nr:exonuclease SbcCD subunit D [Clostridiales bacterium]
MKIFHTSDWHLGKMIYGHSLLPDQAHFVNEVFLPAVRRERPDLVLLAGDIFDRQIAPVEAIRLFDRFVSDMSALHVPLALIAGNHDGAERIAVGAGLLRQSGVYIGSSIADVFQPAVVRAGNAEAHVYLLPYCEPAAVREFLKDNSLRSFQDAYTALLDRVRGQLAPGVFNILLAHCFVIGGALSASESPTFVGGSSEVNPSVFAGFDYVALGHLHGPQRAGKNGRYSGSPLKYSFDEAGQKKSFTVLDVENKTAAVSEYSRPPLHDLRVLSGEFTQLLENAKAAPSEDYLYANLKDRAPVYMPMDQLRPYYPNLLGLSSEWLSAAGGAEKNGELHEQLMRRKTDDLYIFEQFLSQICGCEADDGDRELFLQAMRPSGEEIV